MVRAMVVLEGLLYRPISHVPNIRAPVLYLVAKDDILFKEADTRAALNKTPDGRLYSVKGGHFNVYTGIQFPYMVQHMIAFLRDKNGMPRLIMSSAEAAGLPRRPPHAEHKSADPGGEDEIQAERTVIVENAAEL